jgi:hypothetical protein
MLGNPENFSTLLCVFFLFFLEPLCQIGDVVFHMFVSRAVVRNGGLGYM